jgi:peptidoglycan hydrolase CwlO-like protein
MKRLVLYCYVATSVIGLTTASCSTTTSTEKEDVKAMDSVSAELEKTNKELEEEVKKLEASLEKTEMEFSHSK